MKKVMIILLGILILSGAGVLVCNKMDDGDRYSPYGAYFYTSEVNVDRYSSAPGSNLKFCSAVDVITVKPIDKEDSSILRENHGMETDRAYYITPEKVIVKHEDIMSGFVQMPQTEEGLCEAIFFDDYALLRVVYPGTLKTEVFTMDKDFLTKIDQYGKIVTVYYYQKQEVVTMGGWELARYILMSLLLVEEILLIQFASLHSKSSKCRNYLGIVLPVLAAFITVAVILIPDHNAYGIDQELFNKVRHDQYAMKALEEVQKVVVNDWPWRALEGMVLIVILAMTIQNVRVTKKTIRQNLESLFMENRYTIGKAVYQSKMYGELAAYSRLHRFGEKFYVKDEKLRLGAGTLPFKGLVRLEDATLKKIKALSGLAKLRLEEGYVLQENLYAFIGRDIVYLAFLIDEEIVIIHRLVPMEEAEKGESCYA